MRCSLKERFDKKWKYTPGCWIWTKGTDGWGYGIIQITTPTFKRASKAHRVSYELYVGPIPEGKLIRHKCDNVLCVNPDHLIPGTNAENMADMVARGRSLSRKGHTNPNAKLTDQEVAQVVDLVNCKLFKQVEIAQWYGVSQVTVSHLAIGRSRSNM